MKHFSKELINRIKKANPIQEVIAEETGQQVKTSSGSKTTAIRCPINPGNHKHQDNRPSFIINIETQSFHDKICKIKGDVIEFIRLEYGFSFHQSVEYLANRSGARLHGRSERKNSKESSSEAIYSYQDEKGNLLYQVLRFPGKNFKVRRSDDNGGWIYNLGDTHKVLYRLPEILNAEEVVITEGEKDADNLAELGFVATTSPFGAGKWNGSYCEFLTGKKIILCGDNDQEGRDHIEKIITDMESKANGLRLVTIPEKYKDISEVIQRQGESAAVNIVNGAKPLEKLDLGRVTEEEKKIYEISKAHESKRKFNPRPYSDIVRCDHALKFDEYRRFWIYVRGMGIWKDRADLILNSILRKEILGDEDFKRYCVGEIIDDLHGLTYVSESPKEPEPHLIPFNNKIHNLKSGDLVDYNADYFFINKLAVNINGENRDCPTIHKILTELVSPQDVVTLYEIPAYCLYRGYPYPKIFILYGSGGNGKTAYVKILNKVLGVDNISLCASNDLQNNRFASSQLFGKLVNVSSEMDYVMLKNTSRIKQCCGEDLIYCERKFREPFPFKNYAKMVFLTNQVPLTSDKTYAFYRRIFLLEFPNKFVLKENADPLLIEKIPEKEFEGFAWKCVGALKRLYENGFVFTNHERIEDVTERYEDLSNPLNKFLTEYTKEDPDGDISVGDFNERYTAYLKEKGFRVWTSREIHKGMKEKGFNQKTLSATEDEKATTYRAWLELSWK